MLNGRSMTHNDYTSISVKGVSVVDYMYAIVSQDHLHRQSNFQVIRADQLINETDLVGRCDPDHNISDHSVLKWQYEIDSVTEHNTVSVAAKVTIRKIDVSQIPDNFMGNVTLQRDINNTHIDITNLYSEFCNSIKTEMEDFLPVKYVTVNTNTQKKRYNRYKPWWTEKLTELWDMRSAAERGMSGCTNDRQIFIEHKRNFDQEVRSAKRHY